MKQLMELTDGNLASHLKALETIGYIQSSKPIHRAETQYTIYDH